MPSSIPLIRAASIYPMRRWAHDNHLDVDGLLAKAGLEWVPDNDPYLPIPLRGTVRFLVELSRQEGADTPRRIVDGRGGFEIGLIGAAAFAGPTVRHGFRRVSQKMQTHSTHEIFMVVDGPNSIQITDGWILEVGEQEVLHYVQQYVAALVDMICSVATNNTPAVSRVELVPHPDEGLFHLKPWLGDRVMPAKNRTLNVKIDQDVAEAEFPEEVRSLAVKKDDTNLRVLRESQSLADQAGALVESMLGKAPPSLDSLAAAAGTSARSFRRLLSEENTNLEQIVDRVRAETSLSRLLEEPSVSLNQLSRELGYANQETLSRAVKRWTGQTPSGYRRQHSSP